MINCTTHTDLDYIEFYVKSNNKIFVYKSDKSFLMLDNTEEIENKLNEVMEAQAKLNSNSHDMRLKEFITCMVTTPMFSINFIDSYYYLFEDPSIFNILYALASTGALALSTIGLITRKLYLNECHKNMSYLYYKDYINENINKEEVKNCFEDLSIFINRNGKYEINPNNIDDVDITSIFDIVDVIGKKTGKVKKLK